MSSSSIAVVLGLGALAHTAMAGGLTFWAFLVATRRKTAPYRVAVALPVLGLLAGLLGLCLTVQGLLSAFGAVAYADASERSSLLADGIANAMNATAFGIGASVLLFAASAAVSAWGSRRPRA